MDPPIGNGFRLQQQQQQPNLIKVNTTIMPSKMSTSKSKKLLKINNKKVSSSLSLTTRSNNFCKTNLAAVSATSAILPTSLWLRPQTRPQHSNNNNNRLFSCNLSFIVCFLAVIILNNFACFIPTTQASASAQRENTRILPLQSGM